MGKVRHVEVEALLGPLRVFGRTELWKIAGTDNAADLGTKPLADLEKHPQAVHGRWGVH